jgi:hypothetical protein
MGLHIDAHTETKEDRGAEREEGKKQNPRYI